MHCYFETPLPLFYQNGKPLFQKMATIDGTICILKWKMFILKGQFMFTTLTSVIGISYLADVYVFVPISLVLLYLYHCSYTMLELFKLSDSFVLFSRSTLMI